MMEKALVSILDNAFKYTPQNGEVSLSAMVENSYFNDKTDGIHIVCANTGSFIYAKDREKVFERFYRTENTFAEGTGIGLSITKQFIELHNGKIWCVSSEEIGVKFHIVIPLIKAKRDGSTVVTYSYESDYSRIYGAEPMATSYSTTEQDDSVKPKSRLLLVEDNTSLRNFIVSVLNDEYDVMVATNGAEAMEIVEKEVHPELIISDIMMPVMDGFELCNRIKGNTSTSHIPIVLLTARTKQFTLLESFKHEANAYLEKPFSIELLRSCIKNIQRQNDVLKKYYSNALLDTNRIPDDDDPNAIFIDNLKQIISKHIDNSELILIPCARKCPSVNTCSTIK